ncbi:MAG: hypothetical protein V4577_01805 [Bacteroidota bacterium]
MHFKTKEKNITSQFGEDGVIQEIFNRIGTTNKFCIEFGAWDAQHFSNTWNLWYNDGWKALLIEGDEKRFRDLIQNTHAHANVTPLNLFVTPSGETSLDGIVTRLSLPKTPDLLSIDIDGDDYYILEGLTSLAPRVIIIEYNPTIPPDIELVQQPGEYFGASARAILSLAHRKGYRLVHLTDTNIFLATAKDFEKLGIPEPHLAEVFVTTHLTSIVSAYDGRTLMLGKNPYAQFTPVKKKIRAPAVTTSQEMTIQNVFIQILE